MSEHTGPMATSKDLTAAQRAIAQAFPTGAEAAAALQANMAALPTILGGVSAEAASKALLATGADVATRLLAELGIPNQN